MEFDPLTIARSTLRQDMGIYALQYCADEFYREWGTRVKYLFLAEEDYRSSLLELGRTMHVRPKDATDWYLVQIFGLFVAPSVDIPQSREYAQARLTFEYRAYRMPPLQQGEVVILFTK